MWDIGQRVIPECNGLRVKVGETLSVSMNSEDLTREVHVVSVPVERPVVRVVPQPVRANARVPPAFANAGVALLPRVFTNARPRRQKWSSFDDEPNGPPLRPPRIDIEAPLWRNWLFRTTSKVGRKKIFFLSFFA